MNSGFTLAVVEGLLPYRRSLILVTHVLLVAFAYFLAFLLRFEFSVPADGWEIFFTTLPVLVLIRASVFAWFHLYGGLWRYVSMYDIRGILKAVTLSSLLFVVVALGIFADGFPRSVLVLDWVLCLALVGGVRLGIRALRESAGRQSPASGKRALVVGGGDAGEILMREMGRNPTLNYEVVGFVDDDPRKQQRRIHGIEVVGTVDQLSALSQSHKVQEILIAVPSATGEQNRRIFQYCRESGIPFKTVPALPDLLRGAAKIGQLREVKPEDLLGRDAVQMDLGRLRAELQGKRILVTGAGGSIGAELCRQLAAFEPEMLLLFDRAESSLYFIDLEIRRAHPSLKVVPIVGDILDRQQVEEVIQTYAPAFLYHAAAYKHVPLMEEHPLRAIQNNVFGTEVVAAAARLGGVKKFVLISTDKAVQPVSIMGMTKRVAEDLLQTYNGGSTSFVAVRFGNVLGSDGSVLPLFKWQIAAGGPITVTDPDATRYFMLLSEAAQLVIQAGAMGQCGEVFFLDMGAPIRILDMTQNLIRLSGLEPDRDISLELIGLRPGERLREELVREKEELITSEHKNIFMVKNHHFAVEAFRQDIEVLRRLVAARDREGAVTQIKAMASRY